MKRSYTSGLTLLGATIVLGGGLALSSEGGMSTPMSAQKKTGQGSLTMEEAISRAQQAHPGEVLEVELEQEDSGSMYEVTVAGVDGKTREIEIDRTTGKIVNTDKDEDEDEDEDEEGEEDKDE